MGTLLARLTEPSTYAGLAGVALAFGHAFPSQSALTTAIAGVFGALAAVMAEKSTSVTITPPGNKP